MFFSPRFQLFLPQCLSSIGWWGRGCAVWSKEPTLSSGWLCLELLPEHAAGSSFKVSSLKPSTTHTVHTLFSFTILGWIYWWWSHHHHLASLVLTDLFVLQIVDLFLPTCLWPGLTVLQKRFRVSWLSWRQWPESFSHNLIQSSMDTRALPDLNLSELWYKC